MEVKTIHGFEYQKSEYLHQIGYLVDQVSHWKEYADDLRHQVEDLGHDLDQCDADLQQRKKDAQEVVRDRNIKEIKINEMKRVMRSIQDELEDSLTPDTYEMLASVFDLELPFEEV